MILKRDRKENSGIKNYVGKKRLRKIFGFVKWILIMDVTFFSSSTAVGEYKFFKTTYIFDSPSPISGVRGISLGWAHFLVGGGGRGGGVEQWIVYTEVRSTTYIFVVLLKKLFYGASDLSFSLYVYLSLPSSISLYLPSYRTLYLSLSPSLSLFISLPISLSTSLAISLYVPLSFSISLSIFSLSLSLSTYLPLYLSLSPSLSLTLSLYVSLSFQLQCRRCQPK